MGMAASQARFLGLTARKTNVEYEGQQVNQQRTTLANQSANYYNQLLGMTVPTPPSVNDYTKTVYTFQDGNLSNNITALIAQANGEYKVSYVSQWQNDFAPVSNDAAIVFKDTTNPNYTSYKVGSQVLRDLGQQVISYQVYEYVRNANAFNFNASGNDGVIGFKNSATSDVYKLDINNPENSNMKDVHFTGTVGNTTYNDLELIYDADNKKYLFSSETANKNFELNNVVLNGSHVEYNGIQRDNISLTSRVQNGIATIGYVTPQTNLYYTVDNANLNLSLNNISVNTLNTYADTVDDPYLSTLSGSQLTKAIEEENYYKEMLSNKYNTDNWLVRYVKDTTSGTWNPVFYNKDIVSTAIYNDETGSSQSNITSYRMGSAIETEEVKGVTARLEKDATGRYISITLNPGTTQELSYSLTTNTTTDQAAYEDAMNQYEFNKYQYDQSIQEINSKIEIVQAEDKNLELRLKQLDTEQDAIQTEMDAVQKVIEKNTESTFKTFG